MAHHGVPNPNHLFNSNNNNRQMSSQQPKLIPLTTKDKPMTATATANKAPTTGTVKASGTTSSSHKQAILPSKLSIPKKGKAVNFFTHTQSNQSVQLRPKLPASMPDQQHVSSFNSADSGYNSQMRGRSSSDVSNRTSHRSSCTSGQSFSSHTRRQSISETPTTVSSLSRRSQSMELNHSSSQRVSSPVSLTQDKRKPAKVEAQKATNTLLLPPIDQPRRNRSQLLRRSTSMSSLPSGSRCSKWDNDSKEITHRPKETVPHTHTDPLPSEVKPESMPSARISNNDHTPDGSGNKQNIKNERTISPTYMFADMLKSVRAYCGVGYKSVKCQTSCGLEHILSSGGVVGLSNLGNTCYMNSTLQCLSHTVEMTQAFLGLEKSNYKSMLSISRAYAQLMQEMWLRPSPSHHHLNTVAPRELKEKLGHIHPLFAGYGQHDSQEFMRVLLSELHEEMKTKASLSGGPIHSGKSAWESSFEDSAVSRVFMGQLKSTLSCDVCERGSVTFDPFWDLSLPIQEDRPSYSTLPLKAVRLEDCLNLFTKEEIMDRANKPYCPKCQKCRRSTKQMTVERFPPVLALHLMRFSGWQYQSKLNTSVDIPQTLDMTRYASPETANKQYKDRRITYELYAMSNHSGSVSCGHYTALVKHYASNHWYTYNDSSVTRDTSLEQTSRNRYTTQQPYILFYRRCVTAS